MISPVRREEFNRRDRAADDSTQELKNQVQAAGCSVKTSTLAKAIDEHPLTAVCVAALGGLLVSRVLGIRGLRLIALIGAETIARKAMAAVVDKG